ncbi:MAG TPA: PrsW family glutamic-type intramembrane protease [Candidatus Paceibacterota bacterium]|jgi:RsiW-degrading membrane proteinase PrsW (M82 family)|nr:PrsW family glutamic-type intramembrane protease [Candidatus Paceibacterota bacterium]
MAYFSLILPLGTSLILAFLPIYFWLKFYLWQDKNKPEPKKWLWFLFLAGVASTFFIYWLENFVINFLPSDLKVLNISNPSLLILSLIEESVKLFIPLIILKKNKYFDEAIDALVYLIVFALGVAFVENLGVCLEEILINQTFSAGFYSAFILVILRFIGANLLHTLTASLSGIFLALSRLNKKKWYLLLGLILATITHYCFNLLMINLNLINFSLTLLFLWLIMIGILKTSSLLEKIKKPINN